VEGVLRLLRPCRDAAVLQELWTLQAERRPLPTEVQRLRLTVLRAGWPEVRRPRLFDGPADDTAEQAARLIERLSQRLGPEAVLQLGLAADPLPEWSCRAQPWGSGARTSLPDAAPGLPEDAPTPRLARHRPLSLLPVPAPVRVVVRPPDGLPEAIEWGGRSLRLREVDGPERIASGWQRGTDEQRDYYRVETDQGARWWVFRCRRTDRWFVHGLFD
jgi:protein ImuB